MFYKYFPISKLKNILQKMMDLLNSMHFALNNRLKMANPGSVLSLFSELRIKNPKLNR